jgi:hypothetical protein
MRAQPFIVEVDLLFNWLEEELSKNTEAMKIPEIYNEFLERLEKLRKFYSQTFSPQLIVDFFEGWKQTDEWDEKIKGTSLEHADCAFYTNGMYLIRTIGKYGYDGLQLKIFDITGKFTEYDSNYCVNPTPPNTVNDFVSDYDRAVGMLEWKKNIFPI